MTRASAYIHRERLCIIGVTDHKLGPIPFGVSVKLDNPETEGPVDLTKEPSPVLKKALDEAEVLIREKLNEGSLQLAAENLVLRSRQGDQNAMAMLAAVKSNAKRGNPKAQKALTVIKRYIKRNPAEEAASFGLDEALHEADNPYAICAAIVCFGPTDSIKLLARLLDMTELEEKIQSLCDTYSPELQGNFKEGFNLSNRGQRFFNRTFRRKDEYYAGLTGLLCGRALAIQKIRAGGPISKLSRLAGWELGE
jgi:hypothetical protein